MTGTGLVYEDLAPRLGWSRHIEIESTVAQRDEITVF